MHDGNADKTKSSIWFLVTVFSEIYIFSHYLLIVVIFVTRKFPITFSLIQDISASQIFETVILAIIF